jgi:hypothetical protein
VADRLGGVWGIILEGGERKAVEEGLDMKVSKKRIR